MRTTYLVIHLTCVKKNRKLLFEKAMIEGKIPDLLEHLYYTFQIDQRKRYYGSPTSQIFTLLDDTYDFSSVPENVKRD